MLALMSPSQISTATSNSIISFVNQSINQQASSSITKLNYLHS